MNTKAPRASNHLLNRPLGATTYKYVAREAVRPTLFALLGLTAVILTKDLLGYSDLIINRGLSAGTVVAMAFYQAAPIAALMFPFSVLLGCLVAMGRLGADREILTFEASGVPAGRLSLPLLVFAAAMTVVSVFFSMVASPWAYRSLDDLLANVRTEQPWTEMRQGEVAEFAGWRVEAREVSARGDHLKGVLMWMPDVGETIFARSATMEADEIGSVQIHLRNGSVLLSPDENARLLRFD
jgi:lipopolysaccharide export system permease protein